MLKLFITILSISLLASASVALAQTGTAASGGALQRLNNIFTNTPSYSPETTDSTVMIYISQLINVLFGLFGTIFIILMIYAGYNWLSSRGDEKKIGKAQETIRAAILGLIVTSGSYAIWQFVFVRLLQ